MDRDAFLRELLKKNNIKKYKNNTIHESSEGLRMLLISMRIATQRQLSENFFEQEETVHYGIKALQ